ncbi:gamma-glutamylcyclotransferase [Pokkaliibacter plantistimulans]|nr:gamma-glutamylcyclotransferase [Pokkaliibacter plantistimulans]
MTFSTAMSHSSTHRCQEARIAQPPSGSLWVFGYGSLIWRPDFPFIEAHEARLYGYHRSLCVWSHVHRGTPDQPGLVFGLDQGGCCRGRVYRVDEASQWQVLSYLAERELTTAVYQPRYLWVHTDQGRQHALCFVVDKAHHQYAGALTPDKAALAVARAVGKSGRSLDYLAATLSELEARGLPSRHLQSILQQAQTLSCTDFAHTDCGELVQVPDVMKESL